MLRLIFCLPFLLAACDSRTEIPDVCGLGLTAYAGPPQAPRTATFWPGTDPDLPASAMLQGCGLWSVEGVDCVPAASDAQAEIHLVPNHDACVETPSKTYVLATTGAAGVITVYLECVRQVFEPEDDGRPSLGALKLILGHESGHAFGMNWHVPATCDPSAAKSDFERGLIAQGICGPALMNPMIDPNTCLVTSLDGQAYALRDPSRSTSGFAATETADGGCVLTYRPAP